MPLAIIQVSLAVDKILGLSLPLKPYSIAVGLPMVVVGLFFIGWTSWAQWKIGKSTPVPLVPAQKLVVIGPYAYCRNPLMFGVVLYYLGLVLLVGSLAGILLVIVFGLLYALFIKLVKEKELEARFGKEYIEYKKKTPFLIPRIRKSSSST